MIVILAAFILDLIFGDPRGLPHLVVFTGRLISLAEDILWKIFKPGPGEEEDKGRKLLMGILLFIVVTGISVSLPVLIIYLAGRINRYFSLALSVFVCFQLLAVRSLFGETMKVYRALKEDDLEGARINVSMIVGRDTDKLDKEGIIKAAVETVAENTSDGVIAPLFYMTLFGIPGMLFYKAVNTLDSMVGYRNERYLYLGRFSARMDDILNLIPARISGLIMVWAAGLCGFDAGHAMRVFLRDRKNHKSPNSAHTEAAMAGALNIRLAGNAWYFGKLYEKPTIGDDGRSPETDDIRNACRIMLTTSVLALMVCLLALLIVGRK
ncbi:MAG: adenosylcobinamide-phosphate synthase CbiB [Lachnospiraceae bacterium]|nr:adenosylcobinamide-phosphate synthase CbiB [Lachnospiraceae bacterium]